MKKVLLSVALFLSLGITLWAQVPQLFNYQGIARSATGTPLASTPIGLRLTILEGSATGSVDYQETQNTITNTYGLYNVFVGNGLVYTLGGGAASIGAVNWGSGQKFLKVEIDPIGGTDYSNAGTAQLLSVPYALYAANSPATGVTNVATGAGLTGGPITSTGTISMPNVGTAGTYGSGTQVPVFTTDAQGRVTGVTNTAITLGSGTITSITAGAGLSGGTITSSGTISLPNEGTPGTYGSGSLIPVLTTDPQGRVTAVTNTPLTAVTSVSAGAGLSGGTITSTGTISLPNTGTPGMYGSATQVPVFTTDAQGRVISVTNTPIAGGSGSGTVTSVSAGPGLAGGPITTSGSLSLGTTGTAGIYGSATEVPVFTTDIYGRVISVTNTPIATSGVGTVTSVTAGAGLLGGTITSVGTVSMPTVGTAGTYGSATGIPEITTDAYGRVIAVSVNPVSATAGITGSGAANYITKFTAPTVVASSGMYQNGANVGLGTVAPIAAFDAESATDTMAGNFVISNATPPQNGVLNAAYTGTGGTPTTNAVAILGMVVPTGASVATGIGVEGIGGADGAVDVGESTDATGQVSGVQGQSLSDGLYGVGVAGFANMALSGPVNNYGVYGTTDGSGAVGSDFAGEFNGDLDCTGTFTAVTKAFKMDHPLDPANKYLYHSCVESSEMMNIYTGNVTTDASGVAVVKFPDYMEALNRDFRYQLTVMGTFAQAIVSKEMSGNQFEIKTSVPNVKVSWQVTGIRHDAYALAHPIIAEVEKPNSVKGKYVTPEVYGKSKDLQIGRITPAQVKGSKTFAGNTKTKNSNPDPNTK